MEKGTTPTHIRQEKNIDVRVGRRLAVTSRKIHKLQGDFFRSLRLEEDGAVADGAHLLGQAKSVASSNKHDAIWIVPVRIVENDGSLFGSSTTALSLFPPSQKQQVSNRHL